MTLRLSGAEAEALRRRAEREARSMQDVARQAIREYVENHSRAEVSIHLCHERRGELDVGRDLRCDAAWKMEVGPPESRVG